MTPDYSVRLRRRSPLRPAGADPVWSAPELEVRHVARGEPRRRAVARRSYRDAIRAPPRRAYLWLQAASVAAWWLLLWLWPASRRQFVAGDWPEGTLLAFVFADALLLIPGSTLAAVGVRRRQPWALALFAAVVGAALYALLWCAGAVLFAGGGVLSLALMALCVAGNLLAFRAAYR